MVVDGTTEEGYIHIACPLVMWPVVEQSCAVYGGLLDMLCDEVVGMRELAEGSSHFWAYGWKSIRQIGVSKSTC
jgi:hypothetical protein